VIAAANLLSFVGIGEAGRFPQLSLQTVKRSRAGEKGSVPPLTQVADLAVVPQSSSAEHGGDKFMELSPPGRR